MHWYKDGKRIRYGNGFRRVYFLFALVSAILYDIFHRYVRGWRLEERKGMEGWVEKGNSGSMNKVRLT